MHNTMEAEKCNLAIAHQQTASACKASSPHAKKVPLHAYSM